MSIFAVVFVVLFLGPRFPPFQPYLPHRFTRSERSPWAKIEFGRAWRLKDSCIGRLSAEFRRIGDPNDRPRSVFHGPLSCRLFGSARPHDLVLARSLSRASRTTVYAWPGVHAASHELSRFSHLSVLVSLTGLRYVPCSSVASVCDTDGDELMGICLRRTRARRVLQSNAKVRGLFSPNHYCRSVFRRLQRVPCFEKRYIVEKGVPCFEKGYIVVKRGDKT